MDSARVVMTATAAPGLARFFRDSVFVDGKQVARVRRGQSMSFEVAPGEHVLQVRANRLQRSPEVRVQLVAGDEVRFSYAPDLDGREEHRRQLDRWRAERRGRTYPQFLSERWFVVVRDSVPNESSRSPYAETTVAEDDELTPDEQAAVEFAVRAVVEHDADALARMHVRGDLYMYTRNYGRWGQVHLVMPPDLAASQTVICAPNGDVLVDVDMWTVEEGRSDLTLQLALRSAADGVIEVSIEDMHVL